MKTVRIHREIERSATLVPTMWLTLGLFGLLVLTVNAANPDWWNTSGAVMTKQVATNNGVVTTNYIPNDYAAVTQGQVKQFTVKAVDELNSDLADSGGSGAALSNLVYGWQQDYATNNYNTSTNSFAPYNPRDFNAVNVGQLKYIASLVYGALTNAGYAGLYPSWIKRNTNTDSMVANIGQLKEIFDFNLSAPPIAITDLAASTTTPNEIDLNWTIPSPNNANSIVVEQSTDGGLTWAPIATLEATATSYAASSLDGSQSYSYQVINSNASGSSTSPSTVPETPPSGSPPVAPADLEGSMDSSSNMNLTWSESTGATSYLLEREDIATGVWSTLETGSSNAYEDTDYGLGDYRYRVSAVDAAGASGTSNEFPSSAYAVIDLASNIGFIGLSNTGYVALLKTVDGKPIITRWSGGVAVDLDSDFVGIGSVGISDQGIIAGQTVETDDDGNTEITASVVLPGSSSPVSLTFSPFSPGGPVFSDCAGIDYNGTIYGGVGEQMLGPTLYYSLGQEYIWPNYESEGNIQDGVTFAETDYPDATPPFVFYQQTGIVMGILGVPKNGHVIETSYDYSTGSTTYSLDGSPCPISPLSGVNSVGDAFSEDQVYVAGRVTTPPAHFGGICDMNYTERSQHNQNGTTSLIDCPQIMVDEGVTLCQMNPDTESYDSYYLDSTLPIASGWTHMTGAFINDSGAIVGTAIYSGTNTAIPQGPHGVMLLPLQLTSKDRMITGSVKLPDSWTGISLHVVNTTTGQDMGTYANVVENMTAANPTFKIYNSQDDILSESEADQEQAGTLDPAWTSQKVVFYKDNNDPKLLHFATTFDALGSVRVEIIKNGSVMGYNGVTLTADNDFSAVINEVDSRVTNPSPAPVVDPTDPSASGGGGGDGLGLIVVQEPGSLNFPGAIDPSKNDPTQLVLPVHSGTALPTATDHDLSLITLRRPTGLTSNVGTISVTVSAPSSVAVFNQAASQVLANYSVNLAAPAGDLAELATGNAQIWVRGAAANSDVTLTYTYTDANGTVQQTDTVQLSVNPSGAMVWPGTMRGAPMFCSAGGIRRPLGMAMSLMSMKVWSQVAQIPPSAPATLNSTNLTTTSLIGYVQALADGTWKLPTAYVTGFAEGFAGGAEGDWEFGSSIVSDFYHGHALARAKAICEGLSALAHTTPAQRDQMLNDMTVSALTAGVQGVPWTYKNTTVDQDSAYAYCGGYAAGYSLEQILVFKGLAAGAKATTTAAKDVLMLSKTGQVIVGAIDAARRFKIRTMAELSRYVAPPDMAAMRQMLDEVLKEQIDGTSMGQIIITKLEQLSAASGNELLAAYCDEVAEYVKAGEWNLVAKGAFRRLADLLSKQGTDISVDMVKGFGRFYGSMVDSTTGADFYNYLIQYCTDSGTLATGQLKSLMEQFSTGTGHFFTRDGTNLRLWYSPKGLAYYFDTRAAEGQRILHVLHHCIADGPGHSVFTVPRDQLFQIIDQAWQTGGTSFPQGARTVYVLPAGQLVGTASPDLGGAAVDHIALILENNNTVITAFPVPAGWTP